MGRRFSRLQEVLLGSAGWTESLCGESFCGASRRRVCPGEPLTELPLLLKVGRFLESACSQTWLSPLRLLGKALHEVGVGRRLWLSGCRWGGQAAGRSQICRWNWMELAWGERSACAELSPCPERVVVQRLGSGSAVCSRCWAELRGAAGRCHPIPSGQQKEPGGEGKEESALGGRKAQAELHVGGNVQRLVYCTVRWILASREVAETTDLRKCHKRIFHPFTEYSL